MKAMSSCSTSKSDLLASAKTLKANSAGLDSAKTKVRMADHKSADYGTEINYTACGCRTCNDGDNSMRDHATNAQVDSLANSTTKKRAAAASCAEIITIVTEIKTIVAANPENSTVSTAVVFLQSNGFNVTVTGDDPDNKNHLGGFHRNLFRC